LQDNLSTSAGGVAHRLAADGSHENAESVGDVSGQTAPAAAAGFSLLSLPITAQLWPSSAPELVTIEPLQPTGSDATSYAEVSLLMTCDKHLIIILVLDYYCYCYYTRLTALCPGLPR